MPEETGLDTAVTNVGWQRESSPDSSTARRRKPGRRQPPTPEPEPEEETPAKPPARDGVGTNLDVLA